ncbi:MAG: sugar ABC transporter permease, partial [Actinomycetota bacterium]|nr:sugar ABC transporter permease [Actinomycetota bacterium]
MSAPQSSSLSFARRVRGSDHLAGWAFTAPAIALIGLFSIFPIVWSVVLSFQHNDLLTPNSRWVGWANYKQLASDPVFVKAITHTLIYT